MTWTAKDFQFMSRALQLARRGRYTCDPNPRVGCVICKDNKIISEGWHIQAGQAHAEINAIDNAGDIAGSTVYVTLEPCSHHGRTPPCVDVLIKAGVSDVIVAMTDPNPQVAGKGISKLQAAGINVKQGLMEAEARKLNRGFIKRMSSGLPFTFCKLAMSIDGRTALANGQSQWISSEASRKDVHRLRAASAAIMTSAETVIKDDPLLTARGLDIDFKAPVRVIVDRQLKTPPTAKIFKQDGLTVLYTQSDVHVTFKHDNVDVVHIAAGHDWLERVFRHLADNYEINSVMIEAGSRLNASVLSAGLADEIIVYMAPKLLGSDAQPLLNITGIDALDDACTLTLTDVRQVGPDLRLTYSTGA